MGVPRQGLGAGVPRQRQGEAAGVPGDHQAGEGRRRPRAPAHRVLREGLECRGLRSLRGAGPLHAGAHEHLLEVLRLPRELYDLDGRELPREVRLACKGLPRPRRLPRTGRRMPRMRAASSLEAAALRRRQRRDGEAPCGRPPVREAHRGLRRRARAALRRQPGAVEGAGPGPRGAEAYHSLGYRPRRAGRPGWPAARGLGSPGGGGRRAGHGRCGLGADRRAGRGKV
mmetsp:Transcript_22125/g.60459  ORF Transcript_22125/g.60459 Transcript_22125/m.60459 type:complete len:228 (-) Transcript_22125:843-1526(-)